MAFHCDTVIAREDAQFKLPTLDSKLFPSLISVYLPAVVGHETATRLLQSGTALSAREAMHLGLVHQVLSSKRFLSDAEDLLVLLAAVN